MVKSSDLQNRAAQPESILGEHAVHIAIAHMKGPRRLRPAEIADALDAAERTGSYEDTPEGSRFVTLSDTLARQIAADLRALA